MLSEQIFPITGYAGNIQLILQPFVDEHISPLDMSTGYKNNIECFKRGCARVYIGERLNRFAIKYKIKQTPLQTSQVTI